MEDFIMKTAMRFAMVFLAAASIPAASIPLIAQEEGADSSEKTVYAPQGPMGFGDAHSWEMSSVTGELEGKLSSATAKVGDRVVLKTTEKVQTADGTVIPRGTRLVGHITQVQARDATHRFAQLAIAFDHAELKNGQSIAIFTLIRGVNSSAGVMGMNSMNSDGPMSGMGDATSGGATAGGGTITGGRGSRSGGGLPGTLDGGVQGTPATTTPVGDRAGANPDPNPQGSVELAGHGDEYENVGAHQAAAARAIPHPTAIPGVMLAGNSSASGLFLASMKDIQFESGTQMRLGVVADR
jgi:hypothetical protein